MPGPRSSGRHILWRLAQDGVICFGAREGKQHTFVLLDEWAPKTKRMSRDESLAELARRYFTSRGPATLQDFAWWSGLTITDASAGLEMAKRRLTQDTANGQTYWLASSMPNTNDQSPAAYLLPAFDEYTIAYKNRSAALDPAYTKLANSGNGALYPTIVVDGQVVGIWKRKDSPDHLRQRQTQMPLDWSQGDSSFADLSPATVKRAWWAPKAWPYGAISQSGSRSLKLAIRGG